jgi:tRNA-binding protein
MVPAPIKPTVGIETLESLDIRVGTITTVENVPGSSKLVRLSVDFGDHRRTILAALRKERTDPKEVEGKQALFVVNLEARKMAGEVSEGMLFDIGYADGIVPALAVPERPVPDGARAG